MSVVQTAVWGLAVGGMALAIGGAVPMGPMAQDVANPGQPAFYAQTVQPILQAHCYQCHAGLNHRGGFNMETRAALLRGGHHGSDVVPGHPEQSLMVKLIRHEGPADDPMNMPPAPHPKLSDADIANIELWIRAGAVMPSLGPDGTPVVHP